MQFESTKIPGLKRIIPKRFTDDRGALIKMHHETEFVKHGLPACFAEEYYSTSFPLVLRGLHFQVPPCPQSKLVYCIAGTMVDVTVDLRAGSPAYGQWHVETLSAVHPVALFVPSGLAHGVYVSKGEMNATLVCKATAVYSPEYDGGIHYTSVGIDWPAGLIISEKDRKLPRLSEFVSPFKFDPAAAGL